MSLPKFTAQESLYDSNIAYRSYYLSNINVNFKAKVLPQLSNEFLRAACNEFGCVFYDNDGGGIGSRGEFYGADGTRIIINPTRGDEISLDIPTGDIKESGGRGGGGYGELPPIERDENNMPKNPKLDVQIDRLEKQLDRMESESQRNRLESQGRIMSRRDE